MSMEVAISPTHLDDTPSLLPHTTTATLAPPAEIIDLTGELSDDDDEDGEERSDDEDGSDDLEVFGDGVLGENGAETDVLVDQASRAQLHRAILTTSSPRLRNLLADLVERIPGVEQVSMRHLLGSMSNSRKRKTSERLTERQEYPADEDEGGVVSRWQKCVQCKVEFDITGPAAEGECCYHDGDLMVDEEAFPDWDEDCHGPMDTLQNRREYPENFEWSCCEDRGGSEGCISTAHRFKQSSKRQRTT